MAVTRKGRTIVMTAAGDVNAGPLSITSIKLVGTGMTVGQRLIIKEGVDAAGGVRVDHYVQAANEDVEVFRGSGEFGEFWEPGLYLDTVPAAGTWTIQIRYA